MATKVFPTAMTGIDPALSDQIMLADDSNGDKASKTTLNELQSLFLKETDRRLYSHIGTSRIYGGDLSINADNTKFDVTAGFGRKSDSYTDPGDPDVEPISWPDFIGVSTPYISVSPATFVAVDSDSSLVLSPFQFTSSQLKDVLFLGVVVHVNFTAINKALAYFSYIYDWNDWFFNFSVRFKSFLNNGLNFKANGPNLYLDITAGDSFAIGLNYVDDPKNPNVKTISEQTRVGFSLVTRDSIVGFSDSVDVTQYDFNGVLTAIPDGYFTTHRLIFDSVTGSVGLQYGQSVYENLKKAVMSADKEEYVYNPFAETIPTRSILAVQKNATDLTDLDQQRFINLNQINDAGLSQVCGFSNFADNIEIIEGMSYQRQTLYYVEDGGVFYADIEAVNGGDITFVFGQREFTLDCTTGSGVNGRARIALTEGTFQVPKKNWVYVIRSGEAAVLQQAATEPTGAYSMMFTAFIPSVAESLAHGFYNSRRWTDTKDIDGRGAVVTMLSKLRDLTPYKSGLAANITIDTVPSPDSVDFTVEAGVVREIYNQDIGALQLSVDTALVVNGFTNTYEEVSDLNQITADSNGNTLNNKYYQIVVGVSLNADGHPNRLIINKPSGSYGSAAAAFFDTNGYSNTNFADGFKSVYLLFAAVLKTQGGSQITNEALAFGVNNIDLRLVTPGGASSGAGTAAVTEFSDSLFRIYYNLNSLTGIKFDLSGITPNLDRTYTAPNASGILALTSQSDGSIDHGIDLTGILDDDHTQYALLAGRSGDTLKIDSVAESTADNGVIIEGITAKDNNLTIPGNLAVNGFIRGLRFESITANASGSYGIALGYTAAATNSYTTAIGRNSKADGYNASAMGINSYAHGGSSTAVGPGAYSGHDFAVSVGANVSANNKGSFAAGNDSIANYNYAMVIGYSVASNAAYATAMGYNTTAQSYNSFVIGRFNEISGTQGSWVGTEPLFVIGNGADANNRANAMTVLKNGKVGIGKYPISTLDILGGLQVDNQIISILSTGIAPLDIASTTLNINLNADLLDSQHGSYYLSRANHTGTQLVSTISDFDVEVSNNIDVAANTTHRGLTDNPHTVTKTQIGLSNVDNTSDADKPVSTATQTALDLKANDNAVVHLTGNESIGGIKTFSSFSVGPSAAPTTDYQFANKKYVDDSTGTIIPASTVQYSTLVANAVGGWIENTTVKMNAGVVTGMTSLGVTGQVSALTFTDTSLTITGGSISGAHNGTFSGTLQAEQLTSTDDASISGYTRMGSGNTATKKQIKTGTTPSAGSTSNLSIYASSRTKVIGIDMLVDAANGLQIPPNNGNLANSSYNVYINTSGNLAIRPSSAQTNVANRPFRAAITYIE